MLVVMCVIGHNENNHTIRKQAERSELLFRENQFRYLTTHYNHDIIKL